MTANGFESHDHTQCISNTLQVAEETCREKGLQLTPVRRRVLEILAQKHTAMGAYEVLDFLREEGLGSQPPVAYRALDFLVSNGFVHRIERLNAFIACVHPGEHHAPSFLICRECSTVAELPGKPVSDVVAKAGTDLGFTVEKVSIEAEGVCPDCQDKTA
ncbi:Zinc uptake regulation protein [Pelagimonas phthalicica]|uniref:Zinc uptake regulation protein n=1 Tax=Pelagimonas phthalicica TaxID=1037362 RepID=A0A238JB86_9RHOB|nr:Fur family transcriptional regulator [Pelagimonas phthalicica]TDS93833.1 Fur family zinc uptake transcriptional regulator [Pelagimonas phthalicica]SMX27643.1 Zinc uptake regulation protein [Pelagimonas phthalicica]